MYCMVYATIYQLFPFLSYLHLFLFSCLFFSSTYALLHIFALLVVIVVIAHFIKRIFTIIKEIQLS